MKSIRKDLYHQEHEKMTEMLDRLDVSDKHYSRKYQDMYDRPDIGTERGHYLIILRTSLPSPYAARTDPPVRATSSAYSPYPSVSP